MNPLDWMREPPLCGKTFAGPTFLAARALIAAVFGQPMTPEMLEVFRICTGRTVAPVSAFSRAVIAAGRGAGKTLLAAFVVVFLAASRNYRALLGPGELATVALVTPDRRQSRVAMRYIRGLLTASPMLAQLIESETKESITLTTGVVIEVHTASFRSTRGYSFAGVVIDEAAFLPADADGAASPAEELVRAVMPGLARVPGSLLWVSSSPYRKAGFLYDALRRWHGDDAAPVLTWQAPTRAMNPTIAQRVVDEALADDATAARSEWLGEFRDDIASYIDLDTLRRVVIPGRGDLPRAPGVQELAFTDAATGAGRDSWATAWGYRDAATGHAVVTGLLEFTPPFSPEACAQQLCEALRARGITRVVGDRFGGLWVTERLRVHGVTLTPADMPRSQLYLECLAVLTSQRCELPENVKMIRQFCQLERRSGGRGGNRDSVDHPQRAGGAGGGGYHDDIANVVAGLLVELTGKPRIEIRQVPGGW